MTSYLNQVYPNQLGLPQSGNSNIPKSGKHKRQTTKDNILKPNNPPIVPLAAKSKSFDPSLVELPTWLPKPTWDSWVQYRKEINKPIKSQMTVTQAIKLLAKCRDNGHQPETIINASITNGWQGDSSRLINQEELSRRNPTLSQIALLTRTMGNRGYLIGRGRV